MIAFMRKKVFRDERLVQLLLLLSILRGSPDQLLPSDGPFLHSLNHELSLGTSLGNALGPHSLVGNEPYQKSLDRVLANYQRSVLDDLHALGRWTHSNARRDIHAYLLNAESSIGETHLSEGATYFNQNPSPPTDDFEEILRNIETLEDFDEGITDSNDQILEDLELLETLWKQEVDLGASREIFDEDFQDEAEKDSVLGAEALFVGPLTKDKDPSKEPDGDTGIENGQEDKAWSALNCTVDSETGELLAANSSDAGIENGEANLDFNSPPSLQLCDHDPNLHLDFNLDEALKLVELHSEEEGSTPFKDCEADSGCGDSAFSDSGDPPTSPDFDAINASIDDMIQTTHLHPRNVQGRLGGLVRSGSMEQRWQDLASLLSLPSPDAHHAQSSPTSSMASHGTSPIHTHAHPPQIHHPHPLYPPHEASAGPASSPGIPRGVLLHNPSLPPPMPDHSGHNITYSNSMGASSHLVASSMNLTNNADLTVAGGNDQHPYKMESSAMTPEMIYYQQQNSTPEMNQPNDGIWSSILNEDDMQLMDITMTDYNGRSNGEYSGGSYRYGGPGPEDPHRHPQKKHHLFGKRYFQENPNGGSGSLVQNNSNIGGVVGVGNVPIVGAYPPHYPPTPGVPPMEGATALDPSELKYSCSMDFRSPSVDVSGANSIEHVQHNHTYHMSPEGPSGINRPHSKDKKGRKSDCDKNLSRDEKKARTLSLPINCEEIINLPMDEFNERISKFDLTEAQLSLIRDIRRRGKNKVAAQNCRKRKLDQIVHLAEEVKVFQYRKSELRSQIDHFTTERIRIKHRFSLLYRHIFQSLRDADGNPYSPHEFSLQQSADGSILLVPRSSPHHPMDHLSKSRHAKEEPSP